MRLLRLLLLMFLCINVSIATVQAQSQYIPKLIPPSPNAASLMKFTDVPVSTYTGTANITVPIYIIQGKGLSVPVTLNYHTGGVKLKEEAGWVGLGWALAAGGMISRTVIDEEDFGFNKTYFTPDVPQLEGELTSSDDGIKTPNGGTPPNLGPYFRDFLCNYNVNTTSGIQNYYNLLASPMYDMEPDLFQYNFLDKSGSFIITRDRKVVLQNQDNLKITFENNGNSFTITDEHGNEFYFSDKETTQSATGAGAPITSSWYLSKITTSKKDVIQFNYYSDNTGTSVAPEYYETYSSYCSNTTWVRSNGAGTWYMNKTLQSIDFADGQLQFSFDAARTDLRDGKKLNNVKLYSKKDGALNYLKEYDLYYSYFTYPTATDLYENNRLRLDSVKEMSNGAALPAYVFTYNEETYQNSLMGKHSSSIDHWGYFNGISNSTFIPSMTVPYNPPFGSNGSFDYNTFLDFKGADRKPYFSYMKAFSLKQVKYPTGGKTELEYEANDYDPDHSRNGPNFFPQVEEVTVQPQIGVWNRGASSGTIDLSQISKIVPANSGIINLQMIVAFRSSNNDGNVHVRNSFGRIYFRFKGPGFNVLEDVGSSNLTWDPNSPVSWVTLPLSISDATGPYTWEAWIDPTIDENGTIYFQDIRVTLQYKIKQTVQNANNGDYTMTAGGLRIKSITDYDRDNSVAKKRSYEYDYYQGASKYSFGRLMFPPSYVRYDVSTNGNGGSCLKLALTGSSNCAMTSVVQGNIVGYDTVVEYTVNNADNTNTGKTVYAYNNASDQSLMYWGLRYPGLPNVGNSLNGTLSCKRVYANAGSDYRIVSETYNDYQPANRKVYYSIRAQEPPGGGAQGGGNNCIVGSTMPKELLACLYPSINSEKVLLKSTKEITYDQYDIARSVTKLSSNYYDNPKHYQVTRQVVNDSKQNRITSMLKYPQDYIPAGSVNTGNAMLDGMLDRNMVAEVIEKRDLLLPPGSSSELTSGAQLSNYKFLGSNAMGLDRQYQLNIPSPVTNFQPFAINGNTSSQDSRFDQMINFDKYDNSNNLVQYSASSQGPVSLVWDYAQRYPICEVKNAVLDNIAYTSFEADGSGNWNIPGSARNPQGVTGTRSYQLSNGPIQKLNLNGATEYIVSYWSNSGACGVSGTVGSAVQGKTVNLNGVTWTYYQHRVSGSGSVTVSGNGTIDELRLYPAAAQMTTYTYEPLIGITAQCDAGNNVVYYEYDVFGRLLRIRDADRNIVKQFEYQYQVYPTINPIWQPTGNTRCKVCPQNGSYTTNIKQQEQRDINSQTNAGLRWVDIGTSVECTIQPDWQNTATPTRCRIVNGANTSELEQEQTDRNPCSGLGTRWTVVSQNCTTCPKPQSWQNTGNTRCAKDGNNKNTGYIEREMKNTEACSIAPNSTKWVVDSYNIGGCPITIYATLEYRNYQGSSDGGSYDLYVKFYADEALRIPTSSVDLLTVNYQRVRTTCSNGAQTTSNLSISGTGSELYIGRYEVEHDDGLHCWIYEYNVTPGSGYVAK